MPDTVTTPATGKVPNEKADEIVKRYERLRGEREGWYDSAWRSAASWVNPRKSSIMGEKPPGEAGWVDNIFDTTAITANEKLAAWYMANTSPRNGRWFSWGPTARQRARGITPASSSWLQMASSVALETLGTSKFYEFKHESLLDRQTFGTCGMGTFKGELHGPLCFKALECASYVIAADAEGYIDTVMREFKLTLRQAVQQFGKEALSPKMLEAFKKGDAAELDKDYDFIHAVYPRSDRDKRYEDSLNKKFASCYVAKGEKHLVQEGGYDEMPYAVCRWLKWTGEVWGWAPAFTALPNIRSTNFFSMQMEALAEKAAFPPVLEPDNLVGTIDSRAGGRTTYNHNFPEAKPQEWQTKGRFDIGLEVIQDKRKSIQECFHGDIIQMFANLEKEVTAFEASQLLSEKLDVIGPEYDRLISEFDTPTLQRVFSILLEEGYFGEPPAELMEISEDGTRAHVDLPEVVYLSRLALAIQAHQVASFDALIARAVQLAQIDPSLALQFLENFELDKCARGLAQSLGVPVDWQQDPRILAIKREAAAKQQALAQAAQAAPGIASAAKNVSEMSPSAQQGMAQAMGAAA